MLDIGFPPHLADLLRMMYTCIKIKERIPELVVMKLFHINKGVRQSCILSPSLFNMFAETIVR